MNLESSLLALSYGPKEVRDFRSVVSELSRKELSPAAAEVDALHRYPVEGVRAMRSAGLLSVGGLGLVDDGDATSLLAAVIGVEEIAYNCSSSAYILCCHLTAAQLSDGADGVRSGLTDHDVLSLSWRQSGPAKVYPLHPSEPSVAVRVTQNEERTAPGELAKVVMWRVEPTATEPLSSLGLRGIAVSQLGVDAGAEAAAWELDPGKVQLARSCYQLYTAAICLGAARGSLQRAVEYVQDRRQFGRRIIDFAGVQSKLMDAIDLWDVSAQRLYESASSGPSNGLPPWLVDRIRLYAQRTSESICDIALQVLGGYGYVQEFGQERRLRDVKTMAHIDGPQLPVALRSTYGESHGEGR